MPKASKGDTYPFVKKLAANDRPTRDAALESLKKFLRAKRAFDDLELQKLCKGLFFSMWFSDRPRTQQRLADDLASLLAVVHEDNFIPLLSAFWAIIAREWDGIDQHRIDKFYLLLRRYVAAGLRRLRDNDWDDNLVAQYNQAMAKVPLNPDSLKVPNAIRLHLFDIYVDELERVLKEKSSSSEDEIDVDGVPFDALLEPARTIAAKHPNKTIRQKAQQYILDDSRLIQWGAVEASEKSDDEDEDEWGGFD